MLWLTPWGFKSPYPHQKSNFFCFSSCSSFHKFAKIINIRMKGITLLFSVVLALFSFHGAIADEEVDAARAATRRSSSATVVSSNRQTNQTNQTPQTNTSTGISRSTNTATTGVSTRERNTNTRTNVVVRDNGTRTSTETENQTVSARATSNVQSRATISQNSVVSVPARTATVVRNALTSTSRTSKFKLSWYYHYCITKCDS